MLGRLEHPPDQAVRLVVEAIPLQAGRDERRVVGPDRAGVVADRVVARLALGVRADPPAREELRRQEPVDDLLRPVARHDPRPQALPGVRTDRVRGALGAVERHGVVALVLDPEGLLESLAQQLGLVLQAGRELVLAAQPRERRDAPLGVEHVALDLGERDRSHDLGAVPVADRRRANPSSPGSPGPCGCAARTRRTRRRRGRPSGRSTRARRARWARTGRPAPGRRSSRGRAQDDENSGVESTEP